MERKDLIWSIVLLPHPDGQISMLILLNEAIVFNSEYYVVANDALFSSGQTDALGEVKPSEGRNVFFLRIIVLSTCPSTAIHEFVLLNQGASNSCLWDRRTTITTPGNSLRLQLEAFGSCFVETNETFE